MGDARKKEEEPAKRANCEILLVASGNSRMRQVHLWADCVPQAEMCRQCGFSLHTSKSTSYC